MLSIRAMSEINKAIYSKSNENLSFEYMYSYLTRKTSFLTRGFLRDKSEDHEEVMHTFIQTLSWLFSICDKLDINPEDAFYKKFPYCCPYCLNTPCKCTQTHRKPEKIKSAIYIKEELNNKYIGQIMNSNPKPEPCKMINSIYPSNKNIWSVFGGFYHSARLFEELGELQEAYSRLQKDKNYNIENLHEECADIFAWLFSLWGIKFDKTHEGLGSKFQDYYINGCPVCYKKECICKPYSGRTLTTENKKELLTQLESNIKIIIEDHEFKSLKEPLKSVLNGLRDAINSGKDIDSRRTLSEVESVLDSVNKSAGHASEIFGKITSIILTIRNLTGL